MKLMTMNVHSLVEEDYERKLVEFADAAAGEKPDILALQEVSQPAAEEVWPDEELEGFVRCRDVSMPVRRGNYAARLAGLLKERGFACSWTWLGAKIGYGRYDEGLAIFSRTPIAETDQFFISRCRDYQYWKTRKVLGIRTEAMKDTWFYTVHMGWWDDEEEPFLNQWNRLNQTLEETGKRKQNVWLMGDFNSPAEVRGQGYDLVCRSGWQDTYVLAEKKDGGITARPEIDGWKDRRSSGREKQETGMRLDYLFCSRPVHVTESRVVCSGKREPVVSDHYGVIIETENWEDKE